MKLKLILSLALILLMAISANAQMKTAMMIGPMNDGDTWSMKWGVVKQVSDITFLGGFASFGQTVEVTGQVSFMSEMFDGKWMVGPVIGMGVDYDDSPGTGESESLTSMIRVTGLASSYAFTSQFGLWAYGNYQAAMELAGYQDYKPGWIGGFGIWFSP